MDYSGQNQRHDGFVRLVSYRLDVLFTLANIGGQTTLKMC